MEQIINKDKEGIELSGEKPEGMSMEEFQGKLFGMMEAIGAKPVVKGDIPLEVCLDMAESATRDVIKGVHKWLDATDEEMNAQIQPAKDIMSTIVNSETNNGSELLIRFAYVALECFRLVAYFQDKMAEPCEDSSLGEADVEGTPTDEGRAD